MVEQGRVAIELTRCKEDRLTRSRRHCRLKLTLGSSPSASPASPLEPFAKKSRSTVNSLIFIVLTSDGSTREPTETA